MIIYRVENLTHKNGLWYNETGIYTGFVEKLDDQFLSTLPMGFDPDMIREGMAWISGADSMEQMRLWLTKKAAKDLYDAGYQMFEIDATNGRHVPNHVVFERHSEISRRDVTDQMLTLWP